MRVSSHADTVDWQWLSAGRQAVCEAPPLVLASVHRALSGNTTVEAGVDPVEASPRGGLSGAVSS